MAPQAFQLFSSLPSELQILVWEHAAAHETFTNINAFSVSMTELLHTTKREKLPSLHAAFHRVCNRGENRQLLGTCALARMSVLRSWKSRLEQDLPTQGKGWFSAGGVRQKVQIKLVEEIGEVIRATIDNYGTSYIPPLQLLPAELQFLIWEKAGTPQPAAKLDAAFNNRQKAIYDGDLCASVEALQHSPQKWPTLFAGFVSAIRYVDHLKEARGLLGACRLARRFVLEAWRAKIDEATEEPEELGYYLDEERVEESDVKQALLDQIQELIEVGER